MQLRLGDTEKAQKAIANAEGPQTSPELWLLKGLLNYQLGELGKARQHLAEADHVASQSDCMRKVAEHLESELRVRIIRETTVQCLLSPSRGAVKRFFTYAKMLDENFRAARIRENVPKVCPVWTRVSQICNWNGKKLAQS